jgi:UDP-N-acetylglucosamine--N-acetylmuramyl-(pentapeptide) pyrophosphoryl-undecaprenol N-acetylglucosamine transferase
MVSDADLSPEWIRDMLVPILLDPDLVAAMSQSAADMGARESDEWLAAEVLDVMENQR